jgi:eukaryotic-like serine/threonine-protein kinase
MTRSYDLLWERWDEVDRLLAAALDVPAEARAAFIHRETAADAPLRVLVLRLLDRLAAEDSRVSAPAAAVVAAAFGESEDAERTPDFEPGSRIGRYTIVCRRGRGGMATVYEAERSDGAYQQRVALKVLRRGLDTEDLVRRFLTERQILSSLNHPNIARLLDGGSTQDGRPYLVMDLVAGEPVTTHADARRLSPRARLALFLGVADAVHAAHRRLVVHRDIKPSNILVDAEGRVKLLDFGIAKILAGDVASTDVGGRALTPEYASPEQLRGDPVTTATDVYQLGLLLRELLSGVRPVPGRPGGGEVSHLSGDLRTIVDKALRPEPEQRYASADEMAADVRRHLAGLPVLAHPESALYRARKFLGRHPFVLPAAATIAASVVLFMGWLARQNRRLERERDVAAAASRRAQETQAFFVDLFRSPDPYAPADPERGRDITVVEALELGTARVREELADEPQLQAALFSTIGGVLLSLVRVEDAAALLEEAVALRTTLGDTTSGEWSDDLGHLGLALNGLSRVDSAARVLERRLDLERARIPVDAHRLSEALRGLAQIRTSTNPLAGVALLEEAVRAGRAGGDSGDLAATLRLLADAYRSAGRPDRSETAAREALALTEREHGRDDPLTAIAAHSLGQTLGDLGETGEAARLIERAVGIFERRLGPDHSFTVAMRNSLGVLLINSAQYAAAESVFSAVLAARRRQYGERHHLVAGALQNLAVAVAGRGRYGEAEALTRRAEAIYRQVLPGSFIVAFPILTRAEIQLNAGDAAGAAQSATAAADLLRGKVPETHPAVIMADCRLGQARAALGAISSARAILTSVAQRLGQAKGVRDSHRRECLEALAALGGLGGPTADH